MVILVLRFPGGRYHATPWGHHVNEGLIEWPPSPWRLLRTLLSVGYTALGWQAGLAEPWASPVPAEARSLLAKLASVLPRYALPPATATHSRHYMPVGVLAKDGRERTTLVFDTWARFERDAELAVWWAVELTTSEAALLSALAGGLGYLGRSESWVEARLASENEAARWNFDCTAEVDSAFTSAAGPHGPGWEQISLLAPTAPGEYEAWLAPALANALRDLPLPPNAKPSAALLKKRLGAQAPYPADWLSCLQVDTQWLHSHGWSQPPGTRKLLYWRRSNAMHAAPRGPAPGRARTDPRAAFVLLSLNSASGNDHALPTLKRSLPQGEMLHRQAVALRMRIDPATHSAVLTGCDESGAALRGRHGHAHVLSLDLDGDDHIDHLLVWAPDGLGASDLDALRAARRTYTKGGVGALQLAWAGAGNRSDLQRLPAPLGTALARTVSAGRVWTSATPFVTPRHIKRSGSNSLDGQLRAELESRGFPQPEAVTWLDPREHELARRLRHHVRIRKNGQPPAVNVGFAAQLSFASAVEGPLCLGYGSHFGLGRFECEDVPAALHLPQSAGAPP